VARGGARPNSGGSRPGAGRKSKSSLWSNQFKTALLRAIKKYEKEKEETIHEHMMRAFFHSDCTVRNKGIIYKTVLDALVEKTSHKTIDETKRIIAPVLLPMMRDDPALDKSATPITADEVTAQTKH